MKRGAQAWIKKIWVIGLPTNQWIMQSTVYLSKTLAIRALKWASTGNSIRQNCDHKSGFWPLGTILVRKMSYCSSTIRRFAVFLG